MNQFVNTTDYSILELVLFAIGCYLWCAIYFIYIRNIVKRNFLEIPLLAATGDIAWEFLWSTFFKPDMGLLFVWGYRAWLVLDVYLFYSLVKYAHNQLPDNLKAWWNWWTVSFITLGWAVIFYTFKIEGLDAVVGARSAFPLNLLISFLYIPLFLRKKGEQPFSYVVAWIKMISTTFNVTFLFLHYPNDVFLLSVGPMIWILDVFYIGLHVKYREEVKRVYEASLLKKPKPELALQPV